MLNKIMTEVGIVALLFIIMFMGVEAFFQTPPEALRSDVLMALGINR